MRTAEFDPLTESDIDTLGAWVESHYVKGFMIREDDGTLRPLKMYEGYCNRHWKDNRRTEALAKIDRYGCCGEFCERFTVTVEDPDDNSETRKREVIYCGRTEEPCPQARIENIVQLFSVLNSERSLCLPQHQQA